MSPHHGHEPGHDNAHHHGHDHATMDWGAMGAHLEREAEVHRPVYEQAAAWIAERFQEPRGVRRVLDLGSGPGVITCLLAEAFPEAEIVAVDGTPALLERTRARAERAGLGDRVCTHEAELADGLGALGDADIIWAANTLHHVGDQREALTDFARLLRPGGLVALVEGGLPPRRLPRDIGIGRPGLEARIEAVTGDWFAGMRAELPGVKQEAEDWSALLAAAGLTPAGTRSFLLDLAAPLTGEAREQVVDTFARQRDKLADRLAADDITTLDRLLDPADPAGLRQRPDVFLLTARTVHVARRD
ncbi:class I SAM-dependent methyltransferase [Streptomyces sp. H27-C3]|uniref:class I SAM-dependent methyltransferase n=1 Tax=Streptomyces sp. H27-C3 TaxID=3046305 RepID=UPI0024BB9728|nr:class I SAM-dependent methyltransferase [Streptomyces sp. H27-C3]MDJ0462766.1 class I SAM-dependent methyltransferase [Streptomyces sp. H27-C3]